MYTTADDYADSTLTTAQLTVGGQVIGNIELPHDEDWFKISLTAGITYVFELKGIHGGGGTLSSTDYEMLALYDGSGGSVLDPLLNYTIITNIIDGPVVLANLAGTGGYPLMSYEPTTSGTYYLVAGTSGNVGTGTYTLKATVSGPDDYADNTSTAGQLTVGAQVTGNIELPHDQDFFKITLTAGTTYLFELKGAKSSGGTLGASGTDYAMLAIYDGSGNPVSNPFDEPIAIAGLAGAGSDPVMSYEPTTSGTYYLVAGTMNNVGTGTYTLKATVAGPDDYADNTSTAGQLAVGGQITGNIELPHDQDWFKISLTAGTTYLLELEGAKSGRGTLGSTGSDYAMLAIYDGSGVPVSNIMATNDLDGSVVLAGETGTSDPLMSYEPTTSGTYYLVAGTMGNTGTGTYTLKATVAGPDDYADNTSTAGQLTVGGQNTGNIELPHDQDWFKVSLTAGTTYIFELTGAHGDGGTLCTSGYDYEMLALYDGSGNPVSDLDGPVVTAGIIGTSINNNLFSFGHPLMSYEPTTSGTYYLVAGTMGNTGTGTYTLRATVSGPDDYADNTATTGQLTVGGQATGNIELPHDQDWFKISLIADTTYIFELKGAHAGGGTLCASYSYYQPDFEKLVLYDDSGAPVTDLDGSAVLAGMAGTGGNPLMSYEPTRTGNYYLVVGTMSNIETGTYTLTATAAGTPADTTAPTVSVFTPTDGATGVSATSNITVTFNEAIQRGTGSIVLKTAAGATVETFDAATGNRLSISGSTLTIDPTSTLANSTDYYLTFAAGTIKDLAGNSYAGITDYDFITVAPADTTAPIVSAFNPTDGATGVATTANIGLTFNESIQRGTGSIILKTAAGDTVETFDAATSSRLSISGSALAIDPTSTLANGTDYYLTFAAGTIKDLAGNGYAGTTTYDFTTAIAADTTAPTVSSFNPADEATGVAVNSNIVLTFSEAIQRGTGNILLKTAAGTVIETYNAAGSSNLAISDNTLTLDPSADLASATDYKVEFAAGSIKDLAGNSYAGTTSYNFTAAAGTTGQIWDGTNGNDTLPGGPGNDTFNGGDGVDTVVLSGLPCQYKLNGNSLTGPEGLDAVSSIEQYCFGSSLGNPLCAANLNPVSLIDPDGAGPADSPATDLLQSISDLYVAYFNRAPDITGLMYWFSQISTGSLTLTTTAQSFTDSPEYKATYPAGQSNRDFINTIYLNLFDRAPDAGGWNYWENDLNHGSPRHLFIYTVIQGAYAPTGGAIDKALLNNKHDVSLYYSEQLATHTSEGFDKKIDQVLNRVTADPHTVAQAEAVIDYVIANPITLTGVISDTPTWDAFWV